MPIVPAQDVYKPTSKMAWVPFSSGIDFKLLRTSPETGTFTVLFRAAAGASFAKHRHLAAGEYYVVSGKMEVRGGVEKGGITALTGDWGYEPLSIVHEFTFFPEPTDLLFTNHGAIQFLDDQDRTLSVLDWEVMQRMSDEAEHGRAKTAA